MLGSKFGEILSFLKQQIGFSSNFVSLFSIVRQNSSVLFSLKFFVLSTKRAYQSTNLVKFHLSSQKPEILHFDGLLLWKSNKVSAKKIQIFLLWIKRPNKSPNFETFLCTGENVPNHNSAFLEVLHHSLVPWKTTPLYFFSLNIIYFGQKHPINV